MNDTRIRDYTPADIPGIVLLLRELADVAIPTNPLNENRVRYILEQMDSHPQLYKQYVAERENELTGFMSVLLYKTVFHSVGYGPQPNM